MQSTNDIIQAKDSVREVVTMNNQIAYIMAVTKIKGLGPKTLLPYLQDKKYIETEEAAYKMVSQIYQENSRIKIIPTKEEFSCWIKEAKACLDKQDTLDIHGICYGDKDYPNGFKSLDKPPLYFFYKGNKKALKQEGIAVIGTRNVTPYTETIGKHIGSYVAQKGLTVISGLALGSDTAGHTGCLQAKGTTIAIVATALDTVYPKKNAPLQNEILANGGCVISEYPIGTPFIARHLVERDRLQSGLAKGVIVAATGEIGGTWHAVNEAFSLNKPVAYFDYTKCKKYDYKNDPHVLGMSKMKIKGAKPIFYGREVDVFLKSCVQLKEKGMNR